MDVRFIKWKKVKSNFVECLGWKTLSNLDFPEEYEEVSIVGIVLYEDSENIILSSAIKDKQCYNAIKISKNHIVESKHLTTGNELKIEEIANPNDNLDIEIDEQELIRLYPTTSFSKLAKIFNVSTSKIGQLINKLVNENKLERRAPLPTSNKPANLKRYLQERGVSSKEFTRLYNEGYSYSKLSRYFNLKPSSVIYAIQLLKDNKNIEGNKYNDLIDINKFIELYPIKTISELHRYFNLSRDTVRSIIKSLSIQGLLDPDKKPRLSGKVRTYVKNIDINKFIPDYYKLSYTQLEDKYNICSSSISNLVKDLVKKGLVTYKGRC